MKEKYMIERIDIPLIDVSTVGGERSYIEGDVELMLKKYSTLHEGKLFEESVCNLKMSALPKYIQAAWNQFQMGVIGWLKENKQVGDET